MDLLTEIEKYLDNASGITFDDGEEIMVIVWFDNNKIPQFLSRENYSNLASFFKNRKVILTIKEKMIDGKDESFYRSSFVDMNTADVVNLNSVLWGENDLIAFKDKVNADAKIRLIIAQFNKAEEKFIPHPSEKTHEPIILNGYKLEGISLEEEND